MICLAVFNTLSDRFLLQHYRSSRSRAPPKVDASSPAAHMLAALGAVNPVRFPDHKRLTVVAGFGEVGVYFLGVVIVPTASPRPPSLFFHTPSPPPHASTVPPPPTPPLCPTHPLCPLPTPCYTPSIPSHTTS